MRVLETDRLLLRDFVPLDWEAINMVLSDAEVTRYMHFASWNEEKRRAWFEDCIANSQQPDPDVYNWAISLKDTGKLIGWGLAVRAIRRWSASVILATCSTDTFGGADI